MKYGCIGEHLGHSFSKEIHSHIADYEYELCELRPDEVDGFMKRNDFLAINVTIPYKETVIPYLSYIDEGARLIGAVNTIVKRDGKLFGYNTDFYGMNALLSRAGISLDGKKVLILGSGGTAKTAFAVSKANRAKEIIKASRKDGKDTVLYTDVYKYHTDADVIINTTPVGMYPNIFDKPIDISKFPKLSGVIDAIYNPLKTPLILEAEARGIKASGGLYMLVMQGIRASEHFLDTTYHEALSEEVFKKIENEKKNIVLIGMPSSGKSTVGEILAKKLSRTFLDTDSIITADSGRIISEIFKTDGEEAFRDMETEAVKKASSSSASVIATGGGAVLRRENVHALRQNGKLYFLDRPLEMLLPTKDRPTASTREAIEKRFKERYSIYKSSADVVIDCSKEPSAVAEQIISDFLKS
ncbi:MAG: shikimate dehydrogenase [Ruminococcaceae bacterium]|nr:shikimate dehydrogenase [Oscillospiraceae bacterium]